MMCVNLWLAESASWYVTKIQFKSWLRYKLIHLLMRFFINSTLKDCTNQTVIANPFQDFFTYKTTMYSICSIPSSTQTKHSNSKLRFAIANFSLFKFRVRIKITEKWIMQSRKGNNNAIFMVQNFQPSLNRHEIWCNAVVVHLIIRTRIYYCFMVKQ